MYADREEDENYTKFTTQGEEFLWYFNTTWDDSPPKICVPNDRSVRQLILTQHHSNKFSGHCGPKKMAELIQRSYYWPGLIKDCISFHTSCDVCQRNKHDRNSAKRIPAAEWKAPTTPLHTIGIDFVGELPETKKKHNMIISIIDRLSKKSQFIPARTDITAEQLAKLFATHFIKNEGVPYIVLSDQGSVFMRQFWKEVWRLMGVTLAISSAYHPQTDGVTERVNAEIKKYLRTYAEKYGADWDEQLWIAEFAYNNSVHSSTGQTPFMMTKGYNSVSPIEFFTKETIRKFGRANKDLTKARDYNTQIERNFKMAEQCFNKTALAIKKSADKKRGTLWKDDIFEVGKYVLLSTKNIKDLSTVARQAEGINPTTRKLMPLYIGPYEIVKMKGPMVTIPNSNPPIKRQITAELKLPKYLQLNSTRHCSELKPYVETEFNSARDYQVPPQTPEGEFAVEKILRHDSKTNRYHVKWVGTRQHTWEPLRNLENCKDLLAEYNKHPVDIQDKVTVSKRKARLPAKKARKRSKSNPNTNSIQLWGP